MVLTLAFVGCGSGMKYVWLKDGATRQEWGQDYYHCQTTHKPGFAFGLGIGGVMAMGKAEDRAEGLRRACLRARGWDRVRVPEDSTVGFEEDR